MFILILYLILCFGASGCQQVREVIALEVVEINTTVDTKRQVKVGFYTYFAPVSYSANSDPVSDAFDAHLGYEADLLTAIETMEGTDLYFSRCGISEWTGIWLKAAEPEYDLIAGGITILDTRRYDATGTERIAFTAGHIAFRQSLLVRSEDADRLATYASLSRDVRVGVLSGTTGEARLLEITGIVDADGILIQGTRIETSDGILVADGMQQYKITASGSSPILAGRRTLYPPLENMPEVVYLGEDVGESALFEALTDGGIDAIARGVVGNGAAAAASRGTFVVTAIDEAVEYGGFALALEDTVLIQSLNVSMKYLTNAGNIGYAEWLADPKVFLRRAEAWNASRLSQE